MFGGLKKSASRLALVAAAGVLSTGAYAADLGGDCCADLEERVAELEATTARKGNRKVSLTISGQVNKSIMYFNNGTYSNTFFGLDNTNSSTRFNLSGSAKVTPTVTAGFNITIDVADKARTFSVSEVNEDANNAFANLNPSAAGAGNGDTALRLRDANWYIDSSTIGRVTVGRLTTAGAVAGIDLAGVQIVASSAPGLIGGGLALRNGGGASPGSVNSLTDGAAYPTTRGDGIRYNSPTFAGFSFGASVAEAGSIEANGVAAGSNITGRNLGAQIQYAGEFSGVRIAAGLGIEKFEGNGDGVLNSSNLGNETKNIGGSLALMHVPTGLFIQGDYMKSTNTGNSGASVFAVTAASGLVQPTVPGAVNGLFAGERDASRYVIQGGIAQNFFGIGRTTLYGEYGKAESWQFARGAALDGDSMSWAGVGIVQAIDAAAMDLYLGYRKFDGKNAAGVNGDLDVVTGGARIRF